MAEKYILAVDARGYQVELWEERWLRLLRKHPDLVTYKVTESQVKRAIESPVHGCIYSSHVYPEDCCIYYHQFWKKLELVVVVKYTEQKGEIVTLHFCSRRPDGEKVIWPLMRP